MRKVYIANSNPDYQALFSRRGWEVVSNLRNADLIQFTGGADVSPELYGQPPHPQSHCNPRRDEAEAVIFKLALKNKIPMAGICRGGQFLNVMCGGSMYQHVDGHGINGTHAVYDIMSGDTFQATSTHHQMMRAGGNGEILGIARQTRFVEYVSPAGAIISQYHDVGSHDDVEIVWYEKEKCYCFQPHPEMVGYNRLGDRYIEQIELYLF